MCAIIISYSICLELDMKMVANGPGGESPKR